MYTCTVDNNQFEFLIDIIFVQFGGCLFRQVIGIRMGTNCVPLLAHLFLYSYENEILDNMTRRISGQERPPDNPNKKFDRGRINKDAFSLVLILVLFSGCCIHKWSIT